MSWQLQKMYQIIVIFFLTYKRSLAQTANSQQPTSNFYSNNFIFRYIYFANKSSLGIRSVFSLHSVAALFLCLIGASTGLCSMFTKVNIPFVCVANSPLLSNRFDRLNLFQHPDFETSSQWRDGIKKEKSFRYGK